MSRHRDVDDLRPRAWDNDARAATLPTGWLLLLSGGAARGAFQVPIIEGLIERLGPPAAVVGTSVGAVHAAAVGTGRACRLRAIWDDIDGARDFQRPNLDMWHGLFHMRPLRALMARHLGGEWLCETRVGTVDLERAQHRLVPLNDQHDVAGVFQAVIASSSQPGIHERVWFQGAWHVDGGVMHVLPVPKRDRYLLVMGGHVITQVHAVTCFPRDPTPSSRDSDQVNEVWEQAGRALDILVTNNSRQDIERLRELGRGPGAAKVTLYAPPSWHAIGAPFDASRATVRRRMHLGDIVLRTPDVL